MSTIVQPNRGASVPDVVAVGDQNASQVEWLAKQQINIEDRINLKKLSHMRYQHPDLEEIQTFMIGPKKFLGGTFEAQSKEDFDRAANLPTASAVEDLSHAPGGGSLVTITDPEGFPVNVIFGQEPTNVEVAHPEKLILNYPGEKPRRREFNRFEPGPAAVHKLGHFGYTTQQFQPLLKFYTSTFNIVPSDLLYIEHGGQKILVAMFAHLDLDETLVDHHSIFFSTNSKGPHVHHCSFEVNDYDTQQLGHQWLAKKGYTPVWGIGRHILGSQIFDYWWDTTGNMVEHYADGDLVNQHTPVGYVQAGSESLAVWGPDVPAEFLE
ncbi:Glyoxalase/Bleomycin resistance protein/Dihydroxybiphenyl dioxygenase [Penicillium verhagenii]|nr:Glyoxalase/Bleomycin resistance protein/Dihydroxybiphenyl dioxygenase [Penicillium verhagenii]